MFILFARSLLLTEKCMGYKRVNERQQKLEFEVIKIGVEKFLKNKK